MAQEGFDPTEYEFDPKPTEVITIDQDGNVLDRVSERVAVIRTSDRILFKKCRRRWGWASHLRGNLGPKSNPSPLWFGSGFHFALEDLHSVRRFKSASDAFIAYVQATYAMGVTKLPGDWNELRALGINMLNYYEHVWLPSRQQYPTYYHNGEPQVEVNFRIEVPFDGRAYGYDHVIYSGTIDRVAIDEFGNLWIIEYKTAKAIMTLHLSNDPQVSTYCWAGNLLYGRPIMGVIYQQHRKDVPDEPKVLANGTLSVNKQQLTTRTMFKQALLKQYGSVKRAPQAQVDYLNFLATQEDDQGDKFIRRDQIYRNDHQTQAEAIKIMLELEDMLNPNLPLYPNPTRDCAFMCPFLGACVSLDDGSDWESELEALMAPRDATYDRWRDKLVFPDTQSMLSLEPPKEPTTN